jgi:hypothetical protein
MARRIACVPTEKHEHTMAPLSGIPCDGRPDRTCKAGLLLLIA